MLCKLRFDFGVDTKVAESIRKQPADEEFGAQVVELLFRGRAFLLHGKSDRVQYEINCLC